MGTNYYLYPKRPCPCCGRPYESLHIGKSSGGWVFALHVIPEEGIHSLADWRLRWSAPDAEIQNEYGDTISPAEMLSIITERSWDKPLRWTAAMYKRNQAEPGPHGLVRSRESATCTHGPGTYDLVLGDFS